MPELLNLGEHLVKALLDVMADAIDHSGLLLTSGGQPRQR